ncbi:MAG: hypothetical protein PHQ03_08860, partial [Methylococcales bacterium]|nr:hypothetical protein [Methylococcales bacterium]
TVKTNDLSIHGNSGFESVTIAQNVSGIKINSAVESVTLKGVNFDSSSVVSGQGNVVINSATGNLATLSLAANHDETITFSNAIGNVSLDAAGNGVFTLSELQLGKNQNFTATTNDVTIYGNSGQEVVTLANNVTGVSVSSSVEAVKLGGNSSDYTYDVQGGTVVVSDKATGNDVVYIDVNSSPTGSQIQFADKTLTASWEVLGTIGRWTSWGVTVSDPTAPAAPTTISGGTDLPYSVDFSQANLGSYLADVETNVKNALENISKYVSSKVTFNLQVLTENTTPKTLAEANATMLNLDGTQTTAFMAEAKAGVNLNGATPDATLYINLANINKMSFDGTPSANEYDLTSILTHEILHGLAFTGNLDSTGGAKTPYDALVTMQNNSPVFTGTHAIAANANASVPLDSASSGDGSAYYHVALPNDLMSDSIGKGEVRAISSLDVAMLQDMGLTIIGTPPVTQIV